MTRESNNRRRDTFRFSARNQPSDGRYQQERPARPSRPRLNRAMVDRAWELGARPQHPDYRPREDLYRTSLPSARWAERAAPERYNGRASEPAAHDRRSARPEAERRSQGAARLPREPRESASSRQEGRRGPQGAGASGQRRRGQAPFQRNQGYQGYQSYQGYGGYGAEIEPFKNDGHANGVYEYDTPRFGRGNGSFANDGQQPGAAYGARPGGRRGGGGRGRQQDRAFWEEIRQEADELLGQVTSPTNGNRPGQTPRSSRSPRYPGQTIDTRKRAR